MTIQQHDLRPVPVFDDGDLVPVRNNSEDTMTYLERLRGFGQALELLRERPALDLTVLIEEVREVELTVIEAEIAKYDPRTARRPRLRLV